MGCNCRKAQKVHDSLTTNETSENKSFFRLSWDVTTNWFMRTILGLLIFAILMVVTPFILLYLLITFICSGSYSLYIPKFLAQRM